IQISGRGEEAAAPGPETALTIDSVDALVAHGAVDFHMGGDLRVRGDKLRWRRASGLVRIEGAPASFETPFARLETQWIELDPVLQILMGTGKGKMFSLEENPPPPPQKGKPAPQGPEWTLDFLSCSSLLEMDSLVFAIQEPVFHTAQYENVMRASWAVLWLNRQAFQDSAKRQDLVSGLRAVVER